MKSFDWASVAKPCEKPISLTRIRIEGLLRCEPFQRARLCALKLHEHLPDKFAKPEINECLQLAWHDRVRDIRWRYGGKAWSLKRPVAVFIDDALVGDDSAFVRHLGKTYAFNLPVCPNYYDDLGACEFQRYVQRLGREHVYFTFTIDDQVIGSFLIMLYTDLVPHTCAHFSSLCTGRECKNAWGTTLCYKNTRVRRVVQNGWIQIGDIFESKDLDESARNEITIRNESYCVPHDRRGVVSMANDGKQNNTDQFVVSLGPNRWMNRRYVAFGQVIEGANTLKRIENCRTAYEAALEEIVVTDCGVFSFGRETAVETGTEVSEIGSEGENSETIREDCPSDAIDERDVASLLMLERYEQGLYSLSTDCAPREIQRDPANE